MNDITCTFQNAEQVCRLLSNQLPNLKKIRFDIYKSYGERTCEPSCIVDGENESTKGILNVVYFLVDHLQQLVSLYIYLHEFGRSETLFPHIIRQRLNQYLLNRPYRLRCSAKWIGMWL
jgi:hypothetical protein